MNTAFKAVLVGSGFIGQSHLEAMRRLRIEVNGLVDT